VIAALQALRGIAHVAAVTVVSVGSGREVHGKENPRKLYVEGLRTEPTSLVRGSSRRITIMRLRPANIRVINRRENHLDDDLRCLLKRKKKKKENSCS
jgi:hypothetical protein